MAKTSMKVKQQRPQKYKVREYTRCERCGRPHSVIKKFKLCRICFRELAYKGEIPGGHANGNDRSNCRYVNKNS